MKIFKLLHLYRKWWRTWKTLPVLPWIRAASLYKAGRYSEAVSYYETGLVKFSDHPAQLCARLDLSYCLFRTGKFKEAEEQLRYAVAHFPRSREAQLRLAQFQLWIGQLLDAAWTMRRALRSIPPDAEIVATYMRAVLENGGPPYLLKEVIELSKKLNEDSKETDPHGWQKLAVVRARMRMLRGDYERGRTDLAHLAGLETPPVEALLFYGEVLISEDKIPFARQQLRKGLLLAPQHPRLLSLLAESYLRTGPYYNPEFAIQLATLACQHTSWAAPREMHILAEGYYHLGDKMAALLIASKAKQMGTRLLGSYRDAKSLEKLIETLSTGSLA